MSDKMRPIPFGQMVDWALSELHSDGLIFGIPKEKFYRKKDDSAMELFGERIETPIGPAAGPNTQLAQNIVASYLAGSRFFELKTIQILDELEFDKPCILAEDECYNTEWSTELSVQGAFEEYVKGWFIIHVLEKELKLGKDHAFAFNMSIGYDLEGIKKPKVNDYIEGMKDASQTAIFQACKEALFDRVDEFEHLDRHDIESISPGICHSVTLSTMHGCPPDEIESISKYLLSEKKLHTFVKMNPTLLGYDFVRTAFDKMGYGYIALKEDSFTQDLQYDAGMSMVHRLKAYAKELGLEFGVKLSNTLPVQIMRGELPGEEMYMSGRALYALTINLANKVAYEFDGDIKISYSGGADYFNIKDIYDTGIQPITLASTLLKPGGYMRLKQLAETLDQVETSQNINLEKLSILADQAFDRDTHLKEYRPVASRKINLVLPLLDCFIAPCTVGCPIEQDIPEYLKLVSEERYAEAFEVIIAKNPLPGVTGTICDHQCQFKCTRLDYDESLLIRDMKKIAFDNAAKKAIDQIKPVLLTGKARVAIIGAGPAGLSAAWFLRRQGLDVTILEKEAYAGGTVTQVIPEFRIPNKTTMTDVEMIEKAGVNFRFNVDANFDLEALKKDYEYIYLALGATKENNISLAAADVDVVNAIDFLKDYKNDRLKSLGKHVVVAGGGNTAMDTARAATRVAGVESVSIVYRRTKQYMPADREELDMALKDGVIFKELLKPVSLEAGQLSCELMKLGDLDDSGRRTPVGTKQMQALPCDTFISSIGEKIDTDLLQEKGLAIDNGQPALNEHFMTSLDNVYLGGDMSTGPSTVVRAIADSTKVVRDILAKEGLTLDLSIENFSLGDETIWARKGNLKDQEDDRHEGERCLACHEICEICMEVCPNRANARVSIDGREQIMHIDGMCNECGNCEVFCPYEGAPYKEKFTLFWSEKDFLDSENKGVLLLEGGDEPKFKVRTDQVFDVQFNKAGQCDVKTLEVDIASLIYQTYKDYNWMYIS